MAGGDLAGGVEGAPASSAGGSARLEVISAFPESWRTGRSASGACPRLEEVIVRTAWAVAGLAAVTLAAGCTSPPDAPPTPGPTTSASPPAWTEPADYRFVVERRCEGRESLGVYRVTVEGGQVRTSERIDGRTASGEEEIQVPTLGGLLDLARTAAEDGGRMSTSADPVDGHPVTVTFDVSEGGDNAEDTCFHISEYAPRS